jgi:hypothetical protein
MNQRFLYGFNAIQNYITSNFWYYGVTKKRTFSIICYFLFLLAAYVAEKSDFLGKRVTFLQHAGAIFTNCEDVMSKIQNFRSHLKQAHAEVSRPNQV